MADVFKGEVVARLGWKWTADGGVVDDDKLQKAQQITDGTDANEAEAAWQPDGGEQTLLNGATSTLDLTALTRALFDDTLSLTLVTVRAILITNTGTSGTLVVGGAGTNEWSEPFGADGDLVEVPAGSPMILSNLRTGWDVDNSNKNLKLAASGGDVTYEMAIIGTINAAGSGSSSSGA